MIVADTGVMIALLDASEQRHRAIKALYERHVENWILPAAVGVPLAVRAHTGARAGSR